MRETDCLKKVCKDCKSLVVCKMLSLKEGIEKTKAKRQERTGKPYRQG